LYCHILRVRAIPTLESTDSMIIAFCCVVESLRLCLSHFLLFTVRYPVADLGFLKGGFRFRWITADCLIMAGEHVYGEGNLGPFEIASAGFSGPIQRALVRWSSKLPHLFHRPCGADSFLLLMACQTYCNFAVTLATNFYRTAFLIEHIC